MQLEKTNMDQRYYWHVLISHWVRERRRNGLTIPFIIGANNFVANESKVNNMDVRELFRQIISDPSDEVFTLQNCENVVEYVIGLNSVNPKDGTIFSNPVTGKPKLIAALNTRVLGTNIEAVTSSMAKRYNDCIINANYSRINLAWAPFSEEDVKMINEALG
jgi:hypothetical protein